MLIISKEEMEAFNKNRKESAAQALALILQAEFQLDRPNWNTEGFHAIAENAIEHGLGYGLVTDSELYRFAKLMIIFGHDFDKSIPEAERILNNPDYLSWVKINKLEAWAYPNSTRNVE